MISTPDRWPAATASIGYALALTATSGALPYRWDASGLPSGLTLDADSGQIANAPNGTGSFTFVVRVAGADGGSTQKTFTLIVTAAADVLLDQQWHLRDRRVEVAGAHVAPAGRATRGTACAVTLPRGPRRSRRRP